MAQVHYTTVKVMREGRITIPVDIREFEDIQEGDYLKISIEKIEKIYNKFRPAISDRLPKGVKPPYLLKEDLTEEELEAWKKNHQSK